MWHYTKLQVDVDIDKEWRTVQVSFWSLNTWKHMLELEESVGEGWNKDRLVVIKDRLVVTCDFIFWSNQTSCFFSVQPQVHQVQMFPRVRTFIVFWLAWKIVWVYVMMSARQAGCGKNLNFSFLRCCRCDIFETLLDDNLQIQTSFVDLDRNLMKLKVVFFSR